MITYHIQNASIFDEIWVFPRVLHHLRFDGSVAAVKNDFRPIYPDEINFFQIPHAPKQHLHPVRFNPRLQMRGNGHYLILNLRLRWLSNLQPFTKKYIFYAMPLRKNRHLY